MRDAHRGRSSTRGPRKLVQVLGAALLILNTIPGCKTSHSSTLASGRHLGTTQQHLVTNLQELKVKDGTTNESIDYLVQSLVPVDDRRFSLTIEGRAIILDTKPADGSDAVFTDFFSALDRGVATLAQATPGQPEESHLGVLFAAQARGDLNLQKSRLRREDDKTGQSAPWPLGSDFTKERKRYIVNAIVAMFQTRPAPSPGPGRIARSSSPACAQRQSLVAASILPFKRGDLDRMCGERVRYFTSLGFRRIVIFQAIHYAGERYMQTPANDNLETGDTAFASTTPTGTSQVVSSLALNMDSMPVNPINPKPERGKHYRFEILNAPTPGELARCAALILDAGLELTYIPHLESIVTMNAVGESEWRIASAIPADDQEYFKLAYSPVINTLNKKSKQITGKVVLSVGAEVDAVAFHFPDSLDRLINNLTQSLQIRRDRYQIQLNTNGDFYSGGDVAASHQSRGINGCEILKNVLTQKVDALAPSLYDIYEHIAPKVPFPDNMAGMNDDSVQKWRVEKAKSIVPTMQATKSAFLGRLERYLNGQCDGLGTQLKERYMTRFSVGEFSLQMMREHRYFEFFEEALASGSDGYNRINLWTDGSPLFDPLTSKAGESVKKFLQCQN